MRGLKPERIHGLVKEDVERVMKYAAYVLIIHEGEKSRVEIKKSKSKKPRLSVIAVVGSGKFAGVSYERALLLEIGLGRGRPYQKVEFNAEKGGELSRRKWFSLTPEQYRAIAPHLFSLLKEIAEEQMAKWKNGPFYDVVVKRVFFSRKLGEHIERRKTLSYPRGVRFTASVADDFLVKDIYWAEMNLNKRVQVKMSRTASAVQHFLRPYFTKRPAKKDIWSVRAFKRAKYALTHSSLPRHLKVEMFFRHLRGYEHYPGTRHPYWEELAELIHWDGDKSPKYRELALASLSGQKDRLCEIQLEVSRNSNYVVFEVFSSPLEISFMPPPQHRLYAGQYEIPTV